VDQEPLIGFDFLSERPIAPHVNVFVDICRCCQRCGNRTCERGEEKEAVDTSADCAVKHRQRSWSVCFASDSSLSVAYCFLIVFFTRPNFCSWVRKQRLISV